MSFTQYIPDNRETKMCPCKGEKLNLHIMGCRHGMTHEKYKDWESYIFDPILCFVSVAIIFMLLGIGYALYNSDGQIRGLELNICGNK